MSFRRADDLEVLEILDVLMTEGHLLIRGQQDPFRYLRVQCTVVVHEDLLTDSYSGKAIQLIWSGGPQFQSIFTMSKDGWKAEHAELMPI